MRLARFTQFQVTTDEHGIPREVWGLDHAGGLWRRRMIATDGTPSEDEPWEKVEGPERAKPVDVRVRLFALNDEIRAVAMDSGLTDSEREDRLDVLNGKVKELLHGE